MLEIKSESSLSSWILCLLAALSIVTPSAAWAASTLSDIQIRDAYQLDTTDSAIRASGGVVVFAYREVSGCSPGVECRRLALMWLSPNHEVIELPVPEEAFGSIRSQTGGVGLGRNVQLVMRAPIGHAQKLGPWVDFLFGGNQGETLTIRWNTFSTKVRYVRMIGHSEPLMSTAALKTRLTVPGTYHLSTPPIAPRRYSLLRSTSDPRLILVASRPLGKPDDLGWAWKVGLIRLDSDDQVRLLASGEGLAASSIDYAKAELQSLAGPDTPIQDPRMVVSPRFPDLAFDEKARVQLPGFGPVSEVVPFKFKPGVALVVSISGKNPAGDNSSPFVSILNQSFVPETDRAWALRLIEAYPLALSKFLAVYAPRSNEFFEWASKGTCVGALGGS